MEKFSHSQRDERMIASEGNLRKVDFVRIITKAIYSLGYERSGALLEEESQIPLHSPSVTLFMKQILDGNWDDSLNTLREISMIDKNTFHSASLLILEQKFFDFLQKRRFTDALLLLRAEIAPLTNKERLCELCTCIIAPNWSTLLGNFDDMMGNGSREKLLEKLQKLFPPSVMIPEKRLEKLVEQALHLQCISCIFHNTSHDMLSLYSDHQCGREQLPLHTIQILEEHDGEVWFLNFSNNGKYLASSSIDLSAIIWEVKGDGLFLKHKLIGHKKSVFTAIWSPNDQLILTCGVDETVRLWDVCLGSCLHVYDKPGFGFISCSWLPEGTQFFSCMTDKSICTWDLRGQELNQWRVGIPRISDLAVTSDGKNIITMCKENSILMLHLETKVEILIEEEVPITSFSLSRDDKVLLVNLINEEIHLWGIESVPKLLVKYVGHKRTRLIIRSCFGGLNQAFIASGSEDSEVYIWHRSSGQLLERLSGHSGAVNCVSWNPTNPHMLASASDDHTIRIWGLDLVSFITKDISSDNGAI